MFGNYTGGPYISNMTYSPMMNNMMRSAPMMGIGSNPMMGMRGASMMGGAPRTGGFLSSLIGGRSAAGRLTKSFNFSSLLNGASKALGVVNQAIPIVKEVGPMVGNMKQMLKIASIFKDETDTNTNTRTSTNTNTTTPETTPTSQETTNVKENDTRINSTTTNINQNNEPNFFL